MNEKDTRFMALIGHEKTGKTGIVFNAFQNTDGGEEE